MLPAIYFVIFSLTGIWFQWRSSSLETADRPDDAQDFFCMIFGISSHIMAMVLGWREVLQPLYVWLSGVVPEAGTGLHQVTVLFVIAIVVLSYVMMVTLGVHQLYCNQHNSPSPLKA